MARRGPPSGESDVEVLAAYARKLERRLADLEGMVAGRLPHDHDGSNLTSEGESAGRILEADGNGGVQWTDP